MVAFSKPLNSNTRAQASRGPYIRPKKGLNSTTLGASPAPGSN